MQIQHTEKHLKSSQPLKDIVLGLSDGLTVPFALAAGLSGAIDSTHIVVIAGLAEIAAGGISMGLGGYLAAKTEAEHYESEYKREVFEVKHLPQIETEETTNILRDFGVSEVHLPVVVEAIKSDTKKWVDFMMRFELGLEKPEGKRLFFSPLRIGLAYVFGGFIPLFPYFFLKPIHDALISSIAVTLVALFIFGGFKGHFTSKNIFMSGLQTTLIGGIASAAAFIIARVIS